MRVSSSLCLRFKFANRPARLAQVSHSVVLLALLFTSRLKRKKSVFFPPRKPFLCSTPSLTPLYTCSSISGSSGSEYRLAVTALMLSNKVLDDNSAFSSLPCLSLRRC